MPVVTVLPDDARVEAADAETVLAALGRAGLRYRIGCRRGGCGVCKLQLVLGEVRYERPIADSVLSDDERVAGICLSCRAVPITNVVVELQEGDKLRRVLPFGFAAGSASGNNRKETGHERDAARIRAPAGDRSGGGA
jgi:ferredoxin